MSIALKKILAGGVLAVLPLTLQAAELQTQVFNPGAKSLFPVSSTLVTGPTEAVLIDAQFQRDDAQAVLDMIRKSGKELTTIYISHGDPDFYFGLDVITAAYPDAKVVASKETLKHINKTIEKKISYWSPILGENAPKQTVIPKLIEGDTLTVDGESLKVVGLNGPDPKHSYVWIPSLQTVTGGVMVYENVHVWMADSKTAVARDQWLGTLDRLLALDPKTIVPGNFIGDSPMDKSAVEFTRSYVQAFEDAAVKAADSVELTAAMKASYPDFSNESDLGLSAKVIKGEMQWP